MSSFAPRKNVLSRSKRRQSQSHWASDFRGLAASSTMPRMNHTSRSIQESLTRVVAVTLCIWGLAGCGGQPAAVPVAVEPRRASPAPKPPPPPPPPPSPLAGVNPNDVFDEAESPPNFTVVGRVPEVDPKDIFAATEPAPGVDSSHFEIALSGATTGRNAANQSARFPPGFRAVEGTSFSADGWPLRIVCEKDSSEMAFVPAGTIRMGTDSGPLEAQPEVSVELSPFYIDVAEVTLGQFRPFVAAFGLKIVKPLNEADSAKRPALGVVWNDARDYARWVGKELPTEAEWEMAARGSNAWRTPWGKGRAVWDRPRSPGQIDEVMSFAHDRSSFGLFDVAGNAREWCADNFSPKAHAEAASLPPAKRHDWSGPKTPYRINQRVVKGGSPDWSLWHRAGLEMRERSPDVGFRCVLRGKSEGGKK